MKYSRFFWLIGLLALLMTAGCGGGSNGGALNLNGSLIITTESADQGTYMQVTFTTSYTNPQKSDLLGVPITFVVQGVSSYTMNTNNSGTIIQTFLIAKSDVPQFFSFAASTGDLIASTAVAIPAVAPPPLTFSPNATILFANNVVIGTPDASQVRTIGGGLAPFSFFINTPLPNPNISVSINGDILTVRKISATTPGTATITVTDSSPQPKTGTVTVNY